MPAPAVGPGSLAAASVPAQLFSRCQLTISLSPHCIARQSQWISPCWKMIISALAWNKVIQVMCHGWMVFAADIFKNYFFKRENLKISMRFRILDF